MNCFSGLQWPIKTICSKIQKINRFELYHHINLNYKILLKSDQPKPYNITNFF